MDNAFDLDDSFFSCSSTPSFLSADSDTSIPHSLQDSLSKLFSLFPKNLHVAHINAQSVPGHYSDLLASFSNAHLDILLISETFLKPSLPSTHFALPGFVLIRNDRTGKGGGGVAFYLRADLPYKVVSSSPSLYSESAEYIFIEVLVNHSKLLIAVLYSPNLHINYFDDLDRELNNLRPLYNHVIIMGDFNTCLIKNDYRAHKLLDLVSSLDLHILPLSATHHAPHSSPSLLDLMIVSSLDNVSDHGQLTASFSYHNLVYLSYRIRTPKRKCKLLYLRSFRGMDLEALQRDASLVDWSPVFNASDLDSMVDSFNSSILNLYDKHAPLRLVKVKRDPAPWITPELKDAMARKNRAKQKYERRPSDDNLTFYKTARNRCNHLCQSARRRYFHENLVDRNSGEVWKFLKTVGYGKSNNQCKDVDLTALNSHFALPPVSLDSYTKSSTLLELSYMPLPSCPSFYFSSVTEEDVKKSVLAISSSAVGTDNLCSRMIFPLLPLLLPILSHIFNFSLSSCSFPSVWKLAHVIPLPKSSNPSSFSDYRPISILPFLSKVVEHIVHRQVSSFLNSYHLISPFQSGFRPGHSTVTALIKVTDDIRWAMENKSLTLLVLLDFSSAFNSVDFDILLGTLQTINFSSSSIAWFSSYLRGRSQRVRLEETLSDWCDLAAGVPQGGVLSPLLFSIFINTVTSAISSNFHLYADDLQLYRHFSLSEVDSAIEAMNCDLAKIGEWARKYGLRINPSKSQAIIIGSRHFRSALDLSALTPLSLDGASIAYVTTVKNLGVYLDSHLTWRDQVNEISRKVHFTFHSLKCLQSFLPLCTRVLLAQTLIQPIIDYADACFLDATEELLNKLERLQNICIRFVFGLKKFDHVSHFRKELKWLPIRLRRNTRILCLLYNILHNPSYPSYLRERFSYVRSSDVLCRSHLKSVLKFQPHSTDFYSFSFSVHAVRLWNALPSNIRDSDSISVFKRRVKEHYLTQ